MSMDFFSTDWLSQGDISIEGNQIARLWWTLTGELHTILAIPIWLTYIFGIAFILNMKSEFLALWWINEIAFQHLIGWISWSPYYRMLDFYYSAIGNTWALNFAETFLGLFIGLLVSVCLIKLGRDKKIN